jgi:hypothetical protein
MTHYVPYVSKDFAIRGSAIPLDSKEAAWETIDGRMRTAVRKGEKSGAVIRKAKGTEEDVATFRDFCLNPDDIPPLPLGDRHHLYLAEKDGKVIAAILLAAVKDKLFLLCHASVPEAKELEIPSLLMWHVIQEFAGTGAFRILDVGASYRPSLQKYFSGWGVTDYPMIMRPPELHPTVMITPFDTACIGVEPLENGEEISRAALDKKAGGKPWTFFPRATYAIFAIVKDLAETGGWKKDDEVFVTTTTDGHYVSSCVSSAIEQTATMGRALGPKTKAIFLIHEFGFIHPKLAEMRAKADELGIPLIEDCAYGYNTAGCGVTGDYVIYSFTKEFPVQHGGILVGKNYPHKELWDRFGCSDQGKESYCLRMLSPWIGADAQAESMKQRAANYAYYASIFGQARTFFPWKDGTDPGVYALTIGTEEEMQEVSAFVRRFGIECGNYWKNGAIMLPVHQRMGRGHLDYVAGAVMATEREWCGVPDSPKHHA